MWSVSARVETLNEVGDLGGAGACGGLLAAGELDLLSLRAGLQPEAFVLDAAFAGDRGDQQQGCIEVRWVVGEPVLEAVDYVEMAGVARPVPYQPGLALLSELGRWGWRVEHNHADDVPGHHVRVVRDDHASERS